MTESPRIKRDGLSDGVNGTISGELKAQGGQGGAREVCRTAIRACKGRRKRFCSSRCRLLAWAVDAIATALQQGKAEGLREQIGKLAGELKINVVHIRDGRLPS